MIDSIFYFFAFIGVIIFIAYYAYSLISAINNDINRKKRLEEFLKIDEAPMADAKPIVHAHWYLKDNAAFHQCSNCEKFAPDYDDGFSVEEMLSEYCPHCGALMDEKIDE